MATYRSRPMLKGDTYNKVSPLPAPRRATARTSIYKELFEKKEAEYKAELKALNREVGAKDQKIEELQEQLEEAKNVQMVLPVQEAPFSVWKICLN